MGCDVAGRSLHPCNDNVVPSTASSTSKSNNTKETTNGRSVSDKAMPSAKTMPKDALALLKADHAETREALRELQESTERAIAKRGKILAKVAPALWMHSSSKRSSYPAFEEALSSSDDEVKRIEARAEHDSAKAALTALEEADRGAQRSGRTPKAVFDLVDHHAEEEENEMFRMRKLIGKEERVALGERMSERKASLLASGDFGRGDSDEAEPDRVTTWASDVFTWTSPERHRPPPG